MTDLEKFKMIPLLAGCDEVGRGPLVGDVVACAVILDTNKPISGLADSKKLSEKKRNELHALIMRDALCVSLGRASPEEIDTLNILHASMLAMKRAIESLNIVPEMVLVDGNRCPDIHYPCEAIVKGDAKVAAISAASIVAKVVRDAEMYDLHNQYPEYGFDSHKGYPTKAHMLALKTLGPLDNHRKSFKPVRELLS